MNLHTITRWGGHRLALTALLLCGQAAAAPDAQLPGPNPHQADVQLKTDLTHMTVQVHQGAPLPPGGCVGGYSWHTTYGGCRRAETRSESAQCPAGYTGSQARYRTAYILQANPNDVAYSAWGAWQASCQATAPSQATFTVLARPGGVDCRFTEFKIRANYPNGSVASGITLTWAVVGAGALDRAASTTDSRGETSAYATAFDNLAIKVRVSFGSSSQEIVGVCIGGT